MWKRAYIVWMEMEALLLLPPSLKLPLSIRVLVLDEVEKDHVTEESSLWMQVSSSGCERPCRPWRTCRRMWAELLTAPIKATPEPTLMIVGTILNIPAWKSRGLRYHVVALHPGPLQTHASYLSMHHDAEADPIDFEKGPVAHAGTVFVVSDVSGGTRQNDGR